MAVALSLGVTGGGMLHGPLAQAGVWGTTPELSLSGEYSTNPQLLPGESQSGSAAVANIGLPFGWYDDAEQVEFAARARIADASGASPIGHNAYYGSVQEKSDFERGTISLASHIADDSAAVVSAPASGTLTRLAIGERSVDGSLNATYNFTSRFQNQLGGLWQTQNYEFLPGSGLYNYQYFSANDTIQESLTQRTQLQLALAFSRYRAPDLGYLEDSETAQLGFSQALTERWNYSVLFGRSKAIAPGYGTRTYGTAYAANVSWKTERSSLAASLSESHQPSGFGSLTLTKEAMLRADFNKTERLSGYVALRSVRTTDTLSLLYFAGRGYQSATGGLTWAASEKWDIALVVSWQRQKVDLGELSSTGDGVLVSAVRKFGRIPSG